MLYLDFNKERSNDENWYFILSAVRISRRIKSETRFFLCRSLYAGFEEGALAMQARSPVSFSTCLPGKNTPEFVLIFLFSCHKIRVLSTLMRAKSEEEALTMQARSPCQLCLPGKIISYLVLSFLSSCHEVESSQPPVPSMQAMSEEEALAMQAKLEKDGEAPLTICTTNQVIISSFQLSFPASCQNTLPSVPLLWYSGVVGCLGDS